MGEKSSFNDRQKEVITHESGPLLVVSGAGTGKTHVLTGRILYLILEKSIPANNILALTFNEKAANEMKERVDIGLPLGHPEVPIFTFHAFCERVLRERGIEIGIPTDFKILEAADLLLIMRRRISDFKLDYFHTIGSPQKFLSELAVFISRLQDEDISPQKYKEYAAGLAQKLSAAETDKEQEEEQKELAHKHSELAHAYETYERILLETGYLDFSGLLYFTIRLFEKRASVLADFSKRFSHVLVDEFQDTNFAQNKIVTMLAENHGNLCVVGDDDQSIYKWRGASLTNIQFFQKKFPGATTVVLNENYRSSQAILDASYSVIQNNNPDRLEIFANVDKKLASVPKRSGNPPEIYRFSEMEEEVKFVITKANSYLRAGQDTAILVRTNAIAKPFIEALTRKRIPVQHFASADVWNKQAVKDCLAILRAIADPWDDVALFRAVSLPFWKIPMEILLECNQKVRNRSSSLFKELDGSGLDEFMNHFKELLEFSRTHTTGEVLGKFLRDTAYLDKAQVEDPEAIEDIAAFSEKVAMFGDTHSHNKVSDFLIYAQLLEESGQKTITGEILDPTAIKVLTIHAAKGLEFDAVFLPSMVQNRFPSISRRDPLEIPTELIPEALPDGDHHLQEERRLCYVALTRAKKELIVTYSDFYEGKRQWKPSIFIQELISSGKAVEKNVTSRSTKKNNRAQVSLPFEDGKKRFLSLPKLSYSQLDTFSTCPLKYQFRYLFQIPSPASPHMNFGISIHNTLKNFYDFVMQNPDKAKENLNPTLEEIYEKNWIASGYDSHDAQEDQKERGRKMLNEYYKKERSSAAPAFIEHPFSLQIGHLTISGRIDRIDRLPDGTYEVIDYKTGKVDEKGLKNNLQLSLYALACRDVLELPVSRLSLYSIPDLKKISTTRSEKDMEKCKEELLETASEMALSDFAPSPGFYCRFCEYKLICPSNS